MLRILQSVTVILLVFFSPALYGQEYLVGLNENPRVIYKTIKTKGINNSIELPFFDDFSSTSLVPNRNLWLNGHSVFVNTSFGITPPSIGVATFDPFDYQGKFYSNAGTKVFPADTLESRSINLEGSGEAVYLSFFYQPQGLGDMPESYDVFTLEFYSPETDSWELAWQTSANEKEKYLEENNFLTGESTKKESSEMGKVFVQTSLHIKQEKYLKDGFRFRFINYASINVNEYFPGRSTATDHWHLDYVYLDKNRTNDGNIPDVTVSIPQTSLGQRYTQVPANHFTTEAFYDYFQDPMTLSITYTNLGWGTRSVTRYFQIRTLHGHGNTLTFSGGSENIDNGETITTEYITDNPYNFQPDQDSGAFEIRTYLTTDNDPSPLRTAMRRNDTTSYIQWFRDCYAYDDGTAENGYGIFGQGTRGGQVAVQYHNYISDSLRGVYLYFNRALNDANTHPFHIAIWEDDGGKPGRLISKQETVRPVFRDSLNKYVAYRFPKPIFIGTNKKYYIGWIQNTEDFMNIGFDRNTNSSSFAYFNLGQNWENTRFQGSLMIRPIYTRTEGNFPSDYEPIDPPLVENTKSSVTLYPNPVRSGMVFLSETDHSPVQASKIEIFDNAGHLIKIEKEINGYINTQSLSPGMYIMRIWNTNKVRDVKRMLIID